MNPAVTRRSSRTPGRLTRRLAGMAAGVVALAALSVAAATPAAAAGVTQPIGFGANSLGAFGTTGGGPTPTVVPGHDGAVQAAMGCSHAVYLHADGTVWASGWNSWGQLGDGTSTNRNVPTQVLGLTDVVEIAAGCYHSVALKSDGSVWMWGQRQNSNMATPTDAMCPGFGSGNQVACYVHATRWTTPQDIRHIAAGTLAEAALAADGTVYTGGQIGDAHLTLPAPVTTIAMQSYQVEAITTAGQVYAWGNNNATPTLVPGIVGSAIAVGGGSLSGYAVTQDGSVWGWGDNRYGQLGDGTTTSRPTAIRVPGLPRMQAVAGGFWHGIALAEDGTVWGWGDNVDGQLGPQQPQTVGILATQVSGLTGVRAVSAGGYSSLVLGTKPVTLVSLSASPSSLTLNVGESQGVSVAANYSDNTVTSLTDGVTWSSSDTSVATVDSSGTVTAVGAGTAQITAAWSGLTVVVPVTVQRITPVVTWSPPAALVYGQPLTAAQFEVSADVPGSFEYSPALGTVLHAGTSQPLTVTFTPEDTTTYSTLTRTAPVTVAPAPLTIAASDATITFGSTPPAISHTTSGLVNGDTESVLGSITCSTIATASTPVGTYATGNSCSGAVTSDYAVTFRPGTLVVTKALSRITMSPVKIPASVVSQSVTFSALLTDAANAPLVGRLVSFSVGPTPVCSAVTDSNGAATCSRGLLQLAQLLVHKQASAYFAGDEGYEASGVTVAFKPSP